MTEPGPSRLAVVESVGSVLWFLMDGCWMLRLDLTALGLVIPTVGIHLASFRYTERTVTDISVTGAVNTWVLMNVLWMIGDLRDLPALVRTAQASFVLGLLLLAVAIVTGGRMSAVVGRVLCRFRRFRIRP